MRRILSVLAGLMPSWAFAAEAGAGGIDDAISNAVRPIQEAVTGFVMAPIPMPGGTEMPFILAWLIAGALVCTFYFGFINVRGFAQGFRIVRGDYSEKDSPGEVSHFQALTSAVSGTVGLGNIGGVAIAVAIGGPGATFWMVLAGLLGMSTKFAECTLGVKYRQINADGTVSGGPMYYLSRGIAERFPKMKTFGYILAIVFAVCTMLGAIGAGSMFQANQAFEQFREVTGGLNSPLAGNGWFFGVIIAIIAGIVVIGGIKRIGAVTARLVPFMAGIYVLACLVVLLMHVELVGSAFAAIWNGAFTAQGIQGGLIVVLIQGFRRAAFSNEAGLGSAAIAHSAVKTKDPVTEGLVALWEPFIDTVVICTMTALVIIVTGTYIGQTGASGTAFGVALTSQAFATVLPWFPYVLTVAVLLFAFSTMITWAYYGSKAMGFLTRGSKTAINAFLLVFLAAAVVACTMELSQLMDLADSLLFIMAIPNLIGVYLLLPIVKRELNDYFARLKSGEIKSNRELQS